MARPAGVNLAARGTSAPAGADILRTRHEFVASLESEPRFPGVSQWSVPGSNRRPSSLHIRSNAGLNGSGVVKRVRTGQPRHCVEAAAVGVGRRDLTRI